MSREIELSPGQLRKLAELVRRQEVQKLKELKFSSYAEQNKYLRDCNDAYDNVLDILDSAQEMVAQTEDEKDTTKQDIAKDVYDYCLKGIDTSLKFIRSYSTRLTYLDKLKSHSDDVIKQLKLLNPATQQKEAQRLALEASMYKESVYQYAKKIERFVPNQFTRWLKDNNILFEDLVKRNMSKLGFNGPFKNLSDIRKLQVYESIIEDAGQGLSGLTYTAEALGKVGVGFLVFTSAMFVWNIYTAEDKVETAVRESVNALTTVLDLKIDKVVTTAVKAGFKAINKKVATAAITVIGSAIGIGISVLIGMAASALLDLIFSSGTSQVDITDGISGCRVGPMPDGLQLARLVKANYPDI